MLGKLHKVRIDSFATLRKLLGTTVWTISNERNRKFLTISLAFARNITAVLISEP